MLVCYLYNMEKQQHWQLALSVYKSIKPVIFYFRIEIIERHLSCIMSISGKITGGCTMNILKTSSLKKKLLYWGTGGAGFVSK